MPAAGETALIPLHLQNEVIHPEGRITAGFGGPDADREPFIQAARQVLDRAARATVPILYVRMAFRPGGVDVPDNCELYRGVKQNEVMREGSWGGAFVDGLAPRPGVDGVITHNRVNAFYSSGLEAALAAIRASHIVLMGVATHSVVEHTARHAADMGFRVTVVEDACSAHPRERHTASLAAIGNLVDTVAAEALEFT